MELIHGNCRDELRKLDDNSVDAIVTDPPYGLRFMGKEWDYNIPTVEIWKECFRVLKPGGHLLSFAGTRTQHRMAVNIEDAGFEIRDMIAWVYGQGFPKSLDIGKQFCSCGSSQPKNHYLCSNENKEKISREQEAKHGLRLMRESDIQETFNNEQERGEVLQPGVSEQSAHSPMLWKESKKSIEAGKEPSMERRDNTVQKEGELHGGDLCEGSGMGEADGTERRVHHGAQVDNGSNVREAAKQDGGSEPQRQESKQQPANQFRAISEQRSTQKSGVGQNCGRCGKPISEKDFTGFGTSLKPALEPITVARKPFKGTVAENVLKWGTGGINIDGCRVEYQSEADKKESTDKNQHADFNSNDGVRVPTKGIYYGDFRPPENYNPAQGRFPANFIHDGSEEVTELFPESSITGKRSCESFSKDKKLNDYSHAFQSVRSTSEYVDSGSAARFFYVAKASKADRDGSTHPTVKPIKLMRYLCRLVTPPGGTVLDPFMGSGTTGKAAKLEGFDFIGIELEAESFEFAKQRINKVQKTLF